MAWPPALTNTRLANTIRNCEMTGTLPMLASIMLAMDKPTDAAKVCPPTTKVATTICKIKPAIKPMASWLKISSKPWADVGSMTGHWCKGYTSHASTNAVKIRNRRLKAGKEKIGAAIIKAEMRSMGQRKV